MEFRIAATFTESLARLTAQDQKAVKTTAFDLQMDASAPGLSFHKLDRAVDKNFWSVRVNADMRLRKSLFLCGQRLKRHGRGPQPRSRAQRPLSWMRKLR